MDERIAKRAREARAACEEALVEITLDYFAEVYGFRYESLETKGIWERRFCDLGVEVCDVDY